MAIDRRTFMLGLGAATLAGPAMAQVAITGIATIDEEMATDIDAEALLDQPPPDLNAPPRWLGLGNLPAPSRARIQRSFDGIQPKDLIRLTSTAPLTTSNLPAIRGLWLVNPHTQEEVVDVFWADATYHRQAYSRICQLMRDWRLNIARPMDPQLFHLLWAVQHRTGFSRPLVINSGYRTPQTNSSIERAVPTSYHIKCRACDISTVGFNQQDIAQYLLAMPSYGVGIYPRFIHIDTGPKRSWYETD